MLKELLWYLAHAYSGNIVQNMASVNILAAKLFDLGVYFYSPLSMTHPIHTTRMNLPEYKGDGVDWEQWLQFDTVFMNKCDGLILCPGWTTSKGCRREKHVFEETHKPVYTYNYFVIAFTNEQKVEYLYLQGEKTP